MGTWLTRDKVADIIKEALSKVGDASGDIEGYSFSGMTEHHKRVFVQAVTEGMQKTSHDIFLTEDKLDEFATMRDFIDYVTDEQSQRD